MNRLSVKLGFWAALTSAVTFIVYTICFVGILLTATSVFTWTNFSDYLAYVAQNDQTLKSVSQFVILGFGVSFLILLNSLHDYAPAEKKILSRISLAFGTGFTLLNSINYFLQPTIIRLNTARGELEGLVQLVQANPAGLLTAMTILGWSLFLGLATLFIAPIFSGGKLEKLIRYALLLNGIVCLLGGIGFALDNAGLVFLTLNLGVGGTIGTATVALSLFFRRLEKTLGESGR